VNIRSKKGKAGAYQVRKVQKAMGKAVHKPGGPERWAGDPTLLQRARVVLALSLSKRPPGDLVRLIMDWLDDADLYEFCHAYLNDADLEWIQRH